MLILIVLNLLLCGMESKLNWSKAVNCAFTALIALKDFPDGCPDDLANKHLNDALLSISLLGERLFNMAFKEYE